MRYFAVFILTESTNVTDRQTDGESDRQTPCPTPIAQFDGIGRATRAYTWHRVAKTKCCKA